MSDVEFDFFGGPTIPDPGNVSQGQPIIQICGVGGCCESALLCCTNEQAQIAIDRANASLDGKLKAMGLMK